LLYNKCDETDGVLRLKAEAIIGLS